MKTKTDELEKRLDNIESKFEKKNLKNDDGYQGTK